MRRARSLLAVLLLAGCLAPAPSSDPSEDAGMPTDDGWALAALPFGPEHDHATLAHHANLTTPNFEIVGWDPLVSGTFGFTPGGHFCGDAQDVAGGRRLAAVEQRTVGGFALADVTDPAAPAWLGEFVMPQSRVYDMAVLPDGAHVVLVTTDQVNTPGLPVEAPRLEWRSRCAAAPVAMPLAPRVGVEDPLPRPSSIVLVDISDPAAPEVIDQRPLPTAGHSVFPVVKDGRTLLLIAALAPNNGYYQFYEVADTPVGARLVHLATHAVDTGSAPTDPNKSQAHDGWIAQHPVTGEWLAYLAGGKDLAILNVDDPLQPREISRWTDWSPARAGAAANMHSVYPLPETWDGRHFTLLGPEFGDHPEGQPTGTLWVLDTTDPAAPLAVGAWTLPHDVEWSDVYMFSNHYFTAHGRTAFVSMYHGGVWAVDLAPVANATELVMLPSVGVFMADRVSPAPPQTMLRWTPTAQEVFVFDDGTLVVFDGSSGIYTLRFDASRPAPAPEPWPVMPPPDN